MNVENYPKIARAAERLQDLVHHWQRYLILGVGLIIAGAIAIYYSVSATLLSVATLGFLVLLGAALEAIQMNEFHTFIKDLRLYINTGQGITNEIKLTSLAKTNLDRKFKYILSNHIDHTCMACVTK